MFFVGDFRDGSVEVIKNKVGEAGSFRVKPNNVVSFDKRVEYFSCWSKTSDGGYVEQCWRKHTTTQLEAVRQPSKKWSAVNNMFWLYVGPTLDN